MEIKSFFGLQDLPIADLKVLEREIFAESFRLERLNSELKFQDDLIGHVAYSGDNAVGFKIGYRYKGRTFYSWLGGVHAKFRGQGIARKLMIKQHEDLKTQDYQVVRTHTRNHFKEMLILNLKMGFQITGVNQKIGSPHVSIILEKGLRES